MKSDEAWQAAHQKTWGITAFISLVFLIGGLILSISGNATENRYIAVSLITYGSPVPLLLAQLLLADKFAKEPLGHTGK